MNDWTTHIIKLPRADLMARFHPAGVQDVPLDSRTAPPGFAHILLKHGAALPIGHSAHP
jgi:hypothetical protein